MKAANVGLAARTDRPEDVLPSVVSALSSARRVLCIMHAHPDGDAAAALESALPAPVDHLLIQADLTAVAPGPLASTLAR